MLVLESYLAFVLPACLTMVVVVVVGDVVLLHPDLAHAGGPNHTSGGVRMMVYFRVKVAYSVISSHYANQCD